MILRLFRLTRKKLLAEGQLQQYLIYVIGEILLLVIGILIVLSINNWNNSRILRNTDVSVLKNIQSQIDEDVFILKGNIDYNKTFIDGYMIRHKVIEINARKQFGTLA